MTLAPQFCASVRGNDLERRADGAERPLLHALDLRRFFRDRARDSHFDRTATGQQSRVLDDHSSPRPSRSIKLRSISFKMSLLAPAKDDGARLGLFAVDDEG